MVRLSRGFRTESPARSARHDFGAQIQSKRALCRGYLFRRLRTAVFCGVSKTYDPPRRTDVERDHGKHQRSVFSARKEHGVGMSAIRRKQRILEWLYVRTGHYPLFFRMLSLSRRQDRFSAHTREHPLRGDNYRTGEKKSVRLVSARHRDMDEQSHEREKERTRTPIAAV